MNRDSGFGIQDSGFGVGFGVLIRDSGFEPLESTNPNSTFPFTAESSRPKDKWLGELVDVGRDVRGKWLG